VTGRLEYLVNLPMKKRAQSGLPRGLTVGTAPKIGERIQVWWTEERKFYGGKVVGLDGLLCEIKYDDGETQTHDFSETHWKSDGPRLNTGDIGKRYNHHSAVEDSSEEHEEWSWQCRAELENAGHTDTLAEYDNRIADEATDRLKQKKNKLLERLKERYEYSQTLEGKQKQDKPIEMAKERFENSQNLDASNVESPLRALASKPEKALKMRKPLSPTKTPKKNHSSYGRESFSGTSSYVPSSIFSRKRISEMPIAHGGKKVKPTPKTGLSKGTGKLAFSSPTKKSFLGDWRSPPRSLGRSFIKLRTDANKSKTPKIKSGTKLLRQFLLEEESSDFTRVPNRPRTKSEDLLTPGQLEKKEKPSTIVML